MNSFGQMDKNKTQDSCNNDKDYLKMFNVSVIYQSKEYISSSSYLLKLNLKDFYFDLN